MSRIEHTVTIAYIEPDWEMLFLDEECLLEGHSISLAEALSEMEKYNYDTVETLYYTVEDDVMPADVKEEIETPDSILGSQRASKGGRREK